MLGLALRREKQRLAAHLARLAGVPRRRGAMRGRRALREIAGVLLVIGTLAAVPAGVEAAGEAAFVGLPPCRLVDTRGNGFTGAFGPPALGAGSPRDFPLQGQCGIPATALAVSLNVTATSTQGPGFLMLYPAGGVQPVVSTLNYVTGETVANAALVPLGAGGLSVVAGVAGTDLILDVDGYFTDVLVHVVETENLFVGPGAESGHDRGRQYGGGNPGAPLQHQRYPEHRRRCRGAPPEHGRVPQHRRRPQCTRQRWG
jgi:hypothetical protein